MATLSFKRRLLLSAAVLVQVLSREDPMPAPNDPDMDADETDDSDEDDDYVDPDRDDEDDDSGGGEDWVPFRVAVDTVFKKPGIQSRLKKGPSSLWVRAADIACKCPKIKVNK